MIVHNSFIYFLLCTINQLKQIRDILMYQYIHLLCAYNQTNFFPLPRHIQFDYYWSIQIEFHSHLTLRNFLIRIMECPIEDLCPQQWQSVPDQGDQAQGPGNPRLIPNLLLTQASGTPQRRGQRAQTRPHKEGKDAPHQHLFAEKREFAYFIR